MKKNQPGRPAKRKVKNKALLRAVMIVGGVSKLSREINIGQTCVSDWLYKDIKIPAHHIPKIVKATGGTIRPGELRPDIDWDNLTWNQ